MKVPMKVLDYQSMVMLNKSSIRSGRKQNLQPDQMPSDRNRQYIINFHFEHEWQGKKDVRLSVIMEPGVRTAWLDVSPEEYSAIREVQMPELDWEAAVCVGIPPWTQ